MVSKIENGDRGVSVDEWLQLAHALAVPPPLLLIDLASGEDTAVTPRVVLHPWIVWGWIAGEIASPVPSERGGALVSRVEEFGRAQKAVQLYRQEEASSNAVSRAAGEIRAAEYTGDDERLKRAKSDRVDNLRVLGQTLDAMIENGMTPPGKPADVIEAIRDLDLSRYPDRLVVWRGAPDDRDQAPDVMRPPTPADAADFNAAAATRRRKRGTDEA